MEVVTPQMSFCVNGSFAAQVRQLRKARAAEVGRLISEWPCQVHLAVEPERE